MFNACISDDARTTDEAIIPVSMPMWCKMIEAGIGEDWMTCTAVPPRQRRLNTPTPAPSPLLLLLATRSDALYCCSTIAGGRRRDLAGQSLPSARGQLGPRRRRVSRRRTPRHLLLSAATPLPQLACQNRSRALASNCLPPRTTISTPCRRSPPRCRHQTQHRTAGSRSRHRRTAPVAAQRAPTQKRASISSPRRKPLHPIHVAHHHHHLP